MGKFDPASDLDKNVALRVHLKFSINDELAAPFILPERSFPKQVALPLIRLSPLIII